MRIPFCKEAWERGHGSAAEEPDQKPCSEDRYGQQDEKDGGVTAVHSERPEEQEGHRKPGTAYLCVGGNVSAPLGEIVSVASCFRNLIEALL